MRSIVIFDYLVRLLVIPQIGNTVGLAVSKNTHPCGQSPILFERSGKFLCFENMVWSPVPKVVLRIARRTPVRRGWF